jgi:hypothetical protein
MINIEVITSASRLVKKLAATGEVSPEKPSLARQLARNSVALREPAPVWGESSDPQCVHHDFEC